tara:strand:+ start:1232 stop:1495 length:264 start_codon:yes stop_codon:yes gene_type:complete
MKKSNEREFDMLSYTNKVLKETARMQKYSIGSDIEKRVSMLEEQLIYIKPLADSIQFQLNEITKTMDDIQMDLFLTMDQTRKKEDIQ